MHREILVGPIELLVRQFIIEGSVILRIVVIAAEDWIDERPREYLVNHFVSLRYRVIVLIGCQLTGLVAHHISCHHDHVRIDIFELVFLELREHGSRASKWHVAPFVTEWACEPVLIELLWNSTCSVCVAANPATA